MTQTWDAQAYGRNGAFVHELAGGVLEWLNAQMGEFVLDLGCGDGQLTQRLAATGAHVLGVDASGNMVAAARERGIEAEQANAELLPFHDATFDAVFSNAALHWVRDHESMLAQVHRVLKPGGRFVAEMGGHGNIAAIRVALMAVLSGMDTAIAKMASITIRLQRVIRSAWSGMDSGWSKLRSFRDRRNWRRVEWRAGCVRSDGEFWMDCRKICARPS